VGINVNGSYVTGFYTCVWKPASALPIVVGGALEAVAPISYCSDLPASSGETFGSISTYVNGVNHTFGSWSHGTVSGTPNCNLGAAGSGSSGTLSWLD
jgi:hypothetical protein